MVPTLDDVDRGILQALQAEARDASAAEMAEDVGVSASTVRNRIDRMEEEGIIRGYHPEIDYERAGFQLHVFTVFRAPPENRSAVARQALELSGVVRVRELMTGTENVHLEAVGVDSDAVDDLIERTGDLGLEIRRSDIVAADHVQPCNHFGSDRVGE